MAAVSDVAAAVWRVPPCAAGAGSVAEATEWAGDTSCTAWDSVGWPRVCMVTMPSNSAASSSNRAPGAAR